MKYYIVLSPACDLESIKTNAEAGLRPSHVILDLSQLLGAEVYQPGADKVLPIDRMLAKIIGRPEYWALARKLSVQIQEDDVIYCTGEDIGIPIATLCSSQQKSPKIVVFAHNLNRPRGRVALKLFDVANKIDLFVTTASSQVKFLHDYLKLPEERVYEIPSQPTDTSFFKPGLASQDKQRPMIGSGGLERRDYKTLAEATKDLNVDVKICAFSPNAKKLKRAFPEQIPSNMSFRFYDWCELLQLYRDSDIVAVTVFENTQQAGLTTMFEAMACRRPVVVTRSPGIIAELIDAGIVTGVNPCDPNDLKSAIQSLLNDPQKAKIQAQRGYELVAKQFNQRTYVEALLNQLTEKHNLPLKMCSENCNSTAAIA
ncbi:MAG: glycosyltransferase family 4 protein [Scytonema sp. PMC 1069.18]|nr:glycosyltransferase family 4 protein [Scytonema sp. PMC 1069.18]MEC4880633.1 glycosyltransferase family 4 protein [Scytonema sp. PMC 1070.18]